MRLFYVHPNGAVNLSQVQSVCTDPDDDPKTVYVMFISGGDSVELTDPVEILGLMKALAEFEVEQ